MQTCWFMLLLPVAFVIFKANPVLFQLVCFVGLLCTNKKAPSAIHKAWNPNANARLLTSETQAAREKTPPITVAIQINPTNSRTIPPVREMILILSPFN
jgi:hypothetical protein